MMTLMEPMLQREQYIKDLTAENNRLRDALEKVEWVGGWDDESKRCPWCRKSSQSVTGHEPGCARQLALYPAAVTGAA